MLSPVTLWLGPVNLSQVKGATVPDSPAVNITCTGDGSPSCAAIAEGFTDGAGRKLPSLLSSHGLSPGLAVAAAAFSAGGSILKRLCSSAADRAQLVVVHSADASYEASAGGFAPVAGYAAYIRDAMSDPSKLFVATASANPNKSFGSGIQIIGATRELVEQQTGRTFELGGSIPGVAQIPAKLWRMGGNVWIAEYPDIPHGQHATLLAPQVWQGLILPWLAGSSPGPGPGPDPGPGPTPTPTPTGPSSSSMALAFVVGLAAGYAGVQAAMRR